MDHCLPSQIHHLERTLLVKLEDAILPPLAGLAPCHAIRPVYAPVAEDAELQVGTCLNFACDSVASTPAAAATASLADAVLANKHGGSLFDYLAAGLARVRGVNLG